MTHDKVMDFFGAIFVAIAVIGVTAVLFGGWILVTVMRGLGQAINLLLGPTSPPPRLAAPRTGAVRCPRARCHAENPVGVQYCRRCGRSLHETQPVQPQPTVML